jgi:hypothetical protein
MYRKECGVIKMLHEGTALGDGRKLTSVHRMKQVEWTTCSNNIDNMYRAV